MLPTGKKFFISTIKILVAMDSEGQACDFLAETFRGMDGVVDWGYVAEQQERQLSTPYEEGDLLRIED